MKKLNKEVFLTIFIILSISLLGILTILYQKEYSDKKDNIINSLENTFGLNDINNPKVFIDYNIYRVIIDNKNIIDIVNHSNNNINYSKIEKIAKEIVTNDKKGINVKRLLVNKYSYIYNDKQLVIMDNSYISKHLSNLLIFYIIIFILFEIIFFLISIIITRKIVKPVINSFNKQKEFIADASHELKTPLSIIISSLDAYNDNKKEIKYLDNIKSEADSMNKLITRLLDLASSENEDNKKLEKDNLSKTIELSILSFEVKAYEKKIKLKYDIEENIIFNYDKERIKELILILLDNALKHSLKQINISLISNKGSIILMVSNDGDTIKKEDEDKIFERFYRSDKSRNRKEGRYGLGLAIAKNITIYHNGKISASSEKGLTTFKVVFKK